MGLVKQAGRFRRFKSREHASRYFAKRRKNKDTAKLGWAWRPQHT